MWQANKSMQRTEPLILGVGQHHIERILAMVSLAHFLSHGAVVAHLQKSSMYRGLYVSHDALNMVSLHSLYNSHNAFLVHSASLGLEFLIDDKTSSL